MLRTGFHLTLVRDGALAAEKVADNLSEPVPFLVALPRYFPAGRTVSRPKQELEHKEWPEPTFLRKSKNAFCHLRIPCFQGLVSAPVAFIRTVPTVFEVPLVIAQKASG